MKRLVIGLLGHGTVGTGVDRIAARRDELSVKTVLSLFSDSEIEGRFTDDAAAILEDPEIGAVVEVMGGLHPAYEYVSEALRRGKHVVTANKALVAAYYDELLSLAKKHHAAFRCTAAVGGGIPWLVNLSRAARLDKILSLTGVMNGTTNFILDAMNKEGADFAETLKLAQKLGYAEADPAADIDGADIRRKLCISLNVAYGVRIDEEAIPTLGIRNVLREDIVFGHEKGLTLKLPAYGKQNEDGSLTAFVFPAFLPADDLMASLPANYNLISYDAENAGKQCFTGQGAGRFPTAYNVVQDLLDIADGTESFYTDSAVPTGVDNKKALRRFYVRTTVPADVPGCTAMPKDGVYVTGPVPVSEIFAFIEKQREKDPALFAAVLPE